MGLSEIANNLREVWDSKPKTIILLFLGFIGSLILVIDTWQHRRRRKRPR